MEPRDWETRPLCHVPQWVEHRGEGAKADQAPGRACNVPGARCSPQGLSFSLHSKTYWQEPENRGLRLARCLMTHYTRGSYEAVLCFLSCLPARGTSFSS